MNTIFRTASTFFDNPEFLAQGWESLFPGHCALNFEIGTGYGHFLAWLAPRFSDQAFVGVDIVSKVLRGAERRIGNALQQTPDPNVCLSKQDALMMLKELFPLASLDHLYILFPDPWPKDRHIHRRMLREDTLPLFASRLKTGGKLIFVTDDPPYAEAAASLLGQCPSFEATAFPEIDVHTKYEKKWLKQDKHIHRLAYVRLPQADWPNTGSWTPCPAEIQLQLPHWQPAWLDRLLQATYPLSFSATAVADQSPSQALEEEGVLTSTQSTVRGSASTSEAWYFKLHQPEQSRAGLNFPLVIAEARSLAQHSRLLLSPDGQIQIAPGHWLPYLQRRQVVMQALAQGMAQAVTRIMQADSYAL